jgi:4-hydroxythreonine-4-phosphate dehydrogenase
VIRRAARRRGVPARTLRRIDDEHQVGRLARGQVGIWARSQPAVGALGRPERADGAAQLAWIDEATRLVLAGAASALVTGPVSKEIIASSGAPGSSGFLGHTEHLAARTGAREVVMAFWSRRLSTALVTTHLPIARVPRAISPRRVEAATYWLARLMFVLRRREVRLVVCSLNPHAGEGGLLGDEERTRIEPGLARARAALSRQEVHAHVTGPIGAETAFRLASGGSFDAVVAMYHDQATIPMKLLGFGDAVNVSLGLPIIRTSVDHGTGYELAGTGRADARGMASALALASRLSARADALRPRLV